MASGDAAPNGLPDRVIVLAGELREAGLGVSAAEVQDAIRALPVLPLERREVVRAALAAALMKEHSRRRTFDRLFDMYFPLRRSTAPGGATPADPSGELMDAIGQMDIERLRAIARDRVDRQGDLSPEANVSEDSYVFRAMRGLNLDAILSRLRDETVEGSGVTALQRRIIREDLEERMEAFRSMVKDEVFSTLLDRVGAREMAARDRRPAPEEVDLLWARGSDLGVIRTALAPLARRLTVQLSRRRRRAARGRLDVRRTIRGSLSAGGIPLEPRFRRPTAGKPEIWILCDISGSMRAFAKFTLELCYSLSTQFQRVRSFVFVDALDEVTRLFEGSGSFDVALARLDEEASVVFLDGQSWYGNCLEQFWNLTRRDLSPRSTVIVVGDARNNFRSTGVGWLHLVRQRVRKVYWLNPEPRTHWNAGDSVIGRFEPACDAIFEVRNLRQLEEFAARAL